MLNANRLTAPGRRVRRLRPRRAHHRRRNGGTRLSAPANAPNRQASKPALLVSGVLRRAGCCAGLLSATRRRVAALYRTWAIPSGRATGTSAYSSAVRSGRGIDPNMVTPRGKGESEPMTLGQALAAHVRLIVWCQGCNHRGEPDLATQVAQQGSGMPVPEWARLLRCTECGGRDADFVVSGAKR
jgi:hypothetical protein